MATNVMYNGVTLANVLTREFDQSPIDDKSGTDRLGYRYKITVETIANINAAAVNFGVCGVSVPGTTATELVQGVRDMLMEKRAEFTYSIGGVTLLDVDGSTDFNNGPNPLKLSVTQMTDATLRIVWSIEVCTSDCNSDGPRPVLSNRWASTDEIDEQFRITRTWQGVLRVGTGDTTILTANSFRDLCVPILQRGYRRKRMNFVVDPTGLELAYSITDEQMLGDAPIGGAVKWNYQHTEMCGTGGSKSEAQLAISLQGYPRSNKQDLIVFAMRLLQLKLFPSPTSPGYVVKHLAIVDRGGDSENGVDVVCRIMRNPATSSGGTIPLGILNITTIGRRISTLSIANYDADTAVSFGPFGTADAASLAGLFSVYLQTQCDDDHEMPQEGTEGESTTTTTTTFAPYTPTDTNTSIGSPGNYEIPHFDPDAADANVYVHCKIESKIEVSGVYCGMPIARASDDTATDTQAMIQLSRGVAKRIIRAEFERNGAWPMLWNPDILGTAGFTDNQGIEYKLESWNPVFRPPAHMSNGQLEYVIDAEYVFLMSRPPQASEKISVAELPWDSLMPSDTAFPANTMIALTDSENGLQ